MRLSYLHGQTSRSTVWANGTQKCGLMNFFSGTAFTICANQLHLPKKDREGLKLFLKMALNKCNTNFRLEYSVRKNRTTFFRCPVAPRKCSARTTKKVMFHYFPTGLSANLLKW